MADETKANAADKEKAAQDAPKQDAPEAEADAAAFGDDQYRPEQLIERAEDLFGHPSFVVETALRHSGSQEYYTERQAKKAVDNYLAGKTEA